MSHFDKKMYATTIVAVKHNGQVALGGDGQVTMGDTVVKATAQKVRKLHNGRILAGFAGSVADAFSLFEKFEEVLLGAASRGARRRRGSGSGAR